VKCSISKLHLIIWHVLDYRLFCYFMIILCGCKTDTFPQYLFYIVLNRVMTLILLPILKKLVFIVLHNVRGLFFWFFIFVQYFFVISPSCLCCNFISVTYCYSLYVILYLCIIVIVTDIARYVQMGGCCLKICRTMHRI